MVYLTYSEAQQILQFGLDDRFDPTRAVEIYQIAFPGAEVLQKHDIYLEDSSINPIVARMLIGMLPKIFEVAQDVSDQGKPLELKVEELPILPVQQAFKFHRQVEYEPIHLNELGKRN